MHATIHQFVRAAVLSLGVIQITGCSTDTTPDQQVDASPASASQSAAAEPEIRDAGSLPEQARIAMIKTRQGEATDAYTIEKVESARPGTPDHYRSENPAHSTVTEYTTEGVTAHLTGAAAPRIRFELAAWGRSETPEGAVTETAPTSGPVIVESKTLDKDGQWTQTVTNRAEYEHTDGLTEWFLNGPHGLEHGFTLESRPEGKGQLTFDVAIHGDGIEARLNRGVINLHTSPEVIVGRYGDLFAEDRTGKLFPAVMSLKDGRARIQVNDEGAEYPLVVDPTVWLVEANLLAQVPLQSSTHGDFEQVAVDGNWMVIGAPNDPEQGEDAGAAYVYQRIQGRWTFHAKLVARLLDGTLDGQADDEFGDVVAVSGDTVVVGAPGAADFDTGSGSAFVYKNVGGEWILEAKLLAGDPIRYHRFGSALAIDGDRIVVGAHGDEGHGDRTGAAYVFFRTAGTWNFQDKLLATLPGGTDDGAFQDFFGGDVDIAGDTIVVGSYLNDQYGPQAGAAYVFEYDSGSWDVTAKLVGRGVDGVVDAETTDYFGSDVAISGDTIAIGASGDNDQGLNSGSVYLFTRLEGEWVTHSKLQATKTDGTPDTGTTGFGSRLLLDADTLVVNGTYLFERSGGAWNIEPGFTASASDLSGDTIASINGELCTVYTRSQDVWSKHQDISKPSPRGTSDIGEDDTFGDVKLTGDTLIVGAPGTPDNGISSGAAYIYRRTVDGVWNVEAKLYAQKTGGGNDASEFASFGSVVDVDGDTAIVGAYGKGADFSYQGAAYIYRRTGSTWAIERRLRAQLPGGTNDVADGDLFGISVAVDGDTVAVGAMGESSDAGAVYMYTRSGTTWTIRAKVTAQTTAGAKDSVSGADFGSVDMDGDYLVVGARGASDQGADSGSAYVYKRSGNSWLIEQKLRQTLPGGADDGAAQDGFGSKVAISGSTIAIGAHYDDDEAFASGSVYVFTRSGSTWSVQQKLLAQLPSGESDAEESDWFGGAIGLDGDRLIVGAYGADDQASYSGAAYIYERSGGTWSPSQKLTATLPNGELDGGSSYYFGREVTLSGSSAVVGESLSDELTHSGSAYAYRLTEEVIDGGSCSSDDACANGPCVDGVCCASDCDGICSSCSAALTGAADGVCAPLPEDTRCSDAPLSCFSKTEASVVSRCDGEGTCVPQKSSCVGGYACVTGDSYGGCVTTCSQHSHCADSHWCDSGSCEEDKPGGASCSDGEECASGQCPAGECLGAPGDVCSAKADCASGECVDGVCCRTGCSEICMACDVEGQEGSCVTITGAPHHGSCGVADAGCGEGTCGGEKTDECVYPSQGTPCGATSCNGALNEVSGRLCDDQGKCTESNFPVSCEEYRCENASVCRVGCSSHAHCNLGFACDFDSGECVGTKSNGDACEDDVECDSGACTDGVCCNRVCDGQCEACDVSGSEGTCSVVMGAPHGSRPACGNGDNPACAASCAGERDRCSFPAQGTPCEAASCDAESVLTAARVCDGSGSCTLGATQVCAPYGCDADAAMCNISCDADEDCAAGFECDSESGECIELVASCLDHLTVVLANGDETDCSPYLCAAGQCRDSCDTSNDCARGFDCEGGACLASDRSDEEIVKNDEVTGSGDEDGDGVNESSNCSLGQPTRTPHQGWLWLGLALSAFAWRRRRAA